MHPEIGDDVFALGVEDVGPFGVRTAVRADVAADRPDRPVDVGDERAFGAVERVFTPAAESLARTALCADPGCRRRSRRLR